MNSDEQGKRIAHPFRNINVIAYDLPRAIGPLCSEFINARASLS